MTDRYLLAAFDVCTIGGGTFLFTGAGGTRLLEPQDIDALFMPVQVKDLLEIIVEPEVPYRVKKNEDQSVDTFHFLEL